MQMLAEDSRALFVGQAVRCGGQRAARTFEALPLERRIELPVAEDFQLGYCTGLAIAGHVPLSFFPRMDFLIIAANQLVNHLDKMPALGWRPQVIIRAAVGASSPLDPGPQHQQDHTDALRRMLTTIPVVTLDSAEKIVPMYQDALRSGEPRILVEHMSLYD